MIPAAETGCLVIADVSGYTRYLGETELEHAQDVLSDLMETIVRQLGGTLKVSKLEGDAAFCYTLDSEVDGSLLLDTIDQTYYAFRSRLRDVDLATTCDCNACRLIPTLDLKFVAHSGPFVRNLMAGREELTGSTVILVHRLLKNDVKDRLGVSAYALFTDDCVTALGVDPLALGMREYRQDYDEFGRVLGYVEDLEAAWREEEERKHVFVPPEEAQFEFVSEFPAPVNVVWDFFTSPRKRLLWQAEVTQIDQVNPAGRRGPGTTSHCVHGRAAIVEEILDWRPFRYYTQRVAAPMMGSLVHTFEFRPTQDGSTEVRLRVQRVHGKQRVLWPLMRSSFSKSLQENAVRLRRLLSDQPLAPSSE